MCLRQSLAVNICSLFAVLMLLASSCHLRCFPLFIFPLLDSSQLWRYNWLAIGKLYTSLLQPLSFLPHVDPLISRPHCSGFSFDIACSASPSAGYTPYVLISVLVSCLVMFFSRLRFFCLSQLPLFIFLFFSIHGS